MGLIKSIFGKVHHIVINLGRHLLGNPVGHASRHPLLLIAVYEVRPFLFHYGLLFLAHSPAHQIASSQSISPKITDDLHYLLLVNDAAVGGRKNRL